MAIEMPLISSFYGCPTKIFTEQAAKPAISLPPPEHAELVENVESPRRQASGTFPQASYIVTDQ
jgi:hypothetical protein